MTQRPIKFRAWVREAKMMVSVIRIEFLKRPMRGKSDLRRIWWWDKEQGMDFDEYAETVDIMQFTGLHDKNGKDVFEGDILSPGLREVSWQRGEFGMGDGWYTESHELKTGYWTLSKTQTEDSEVIGNIYENPEFIQSLKK